MKRLAILLSLVGFGVFIATANAFMQGGSKPRLDAPPNQGPKITTSAELPKTHLNKNRLHKLIITDKDVAFYNEFAEAKAIRNEIDYGSYKLIVIDEEAVGGRAKIEAMLIAPRDDQNMMVFNGYLIDTSNPQPLSKDLPAALKQSRVNAAPGGSAAPGKGFYIVQFVGPIQDGWLKALEKTGAQIITYAPNNAYVVRADERAAGELIKMKEGNSFVQWVGDFEPAYKLTPELQTRIERGDSQPIRITVQLIDSAEGALKADELKASSPQYFKERRVLTYRNITVVLPVSQLVSLAQSNVVLAIEEDHERKRADEVQGQIVAGKLTGNAPSGPGYLSWLASKGFNSSQFSSFAVNVADDSYSLTGHPDLPDSRVAFGNNPTNMTGPQKGHGFLNSHIIGGFNDGAGSTFEDANGFNYGLGIAPWARVGVTAIFGDGPFSPSEWEETAYSQSARVSSNSWLLDFTWRYDTFAQEYDSIVRDAQRGIPGNQQLSVIFCAGNDARFGTGTVTSPGSAKNVITVGASENVRPAGLDGCGVADSAADSANDIAFFSSRGPVNSFGGDGRVKPDIVAPGTHIQAGVPQSNYDGGNVCDKYFPAGQTLYSWSSGTSHAAPAVAGGAALIYQDYLNKGLEPPSPAMVKALLMNSTSYMTGDGANGALPSNSQGMGLMNLDRTFDDSPRLLTDQTRVFSSSGETYHVPGSIAATDHPVRITLAWTDAPGSSISAPWVNNLDLEVSFNGQTYRGNVFSGSDSTTGGAPDGKNNVESVFLPAGVSGNFLVTVRATNIAGDGVPGIGDTTDQDFALVICNANPAPLDIPILDVNPASLSFTAVAGSGNPVNQAISINNAGVGALDWTASDDASWLVISPASGSAPSLLTASVDISGLSPGIYSASITIRSTTALNSPVSVPVTLTVLPVFSVSPSSLNYQTLGINPPNQTISLANNDNIPRSLTVSDDVPWLMVSPESGAAPLTLTASVNISGLAAGTYSGMITIIPTHAPSALIRVPVSLVVTPPLAVDPASLNFAATFGGTKLPSQTLYISTVDGPPLDWVVSDNAPWLNLSSTSGVTPSRVLVSVDSSRLAIGSYNATIMVRAVNTPDIPNVIPVTLTVNSLSNGGFEESADPWIMSGLTMSSAGQFVHSGGGYLLMGGSNRSGGSAYQQFVVPSGSSNLSFWLNVTSDETTATEQNDRFFVEICDTRGKLLRTLATFSNLNKSTPGNYTMVGNYNLASFAGRRVRVQFRTTSNSSLLTTFRVDDVSIK